MQPSAQAATVQHVSRPSVRRMPPPRQLRSNGNAAAAAGVLERILFFVSAQPDLRASCRLAPPLAAGRSRRSRGGDTECAIYNPLSTQ